MTAFAIVAKRWLREPFIQFLALGTALFVVAELRESPETPDADTIEVPAGYEAEVRRRLRIETAQEPSDEAVQAEVDKYVAEEILYREALRLGFDEHDPIVRRRLIQKMKLILDREVPQGPVSDLEIARLEKVHPELFASSDRVTFEHVYFRGTDAAAEQRARTGREALVSGSATATKIGDAFSRGPSLTSMNRGSIEKIFGREFASELYAVDGSQWSRPIASPHGLHLVRIRTRESSPKPLQTSRVTAAVKLQRRDSHISRQVASYRDRYQVVRGTNGDL